ncbi:unnamed protein product [Orchesella dallaii]|uniref:Uncharacterized protein n=1 Tax=Orchesella dallaii TaxID=48710 RepID=A0ABP1PLH2_9HEXA
MNFAKLWMLSIPVVLAFGIIQVSSTFDRSHMGVVYKPVLENYGKVISEGKLLPQIKKMASEFTKLSYPTMDMEIRPGTVDFFGWLETKAVPKAIASYNRDHLKPGESPLDLSLTLMITKLKNFSAIQTDFNELEASANLANSIYPKTVKKIYLENNFLFAGNKADIDEYERAVANILVPNGTKYEIGATLPLEACEPDHLPIFLRKFKHLAFSWFPQLFSADEADMKVEPDPLLCVEKLTEEFENCKETLKTFGLHVTVELTTSWFYHKGMDLDEHNRNLVIFWNALNAWAVKINITVVVLFAFDFTPAAEPIPLQYAGWWSLKQNISLANITEDSFEEKSTRFQNHSYSTLFWSLIIVGILLLIATIIFAIVKYAPGSVPESIRARFAC